MYRCEKPTHKPLPGHLPLESVEHAPAAEGCASCGGTKLTRIGKDVAEKLDYTLGVFTAERHIRGKWVCAKCERLINTCVPLL